MRWILASILAGCLSATCCGQEIEWGGNPIRCYDTPSFDLTMPQQPNVVYFFSQTTAELRQNENVVTVSGKDGLHSVTVFFVIADFDAGTLSQKTQTIRFKFERTTPPPDDGDDDDDDDDDTTIPTDRFDNIGRRCHGWIPSGAAGQRAPALGDVYKDVADKIEGGTYLRLEDAFAAIRSGVTSALGSYRAEWSTFEQNLSSDAKTRDLARYDVIAYYRAIYEGLRTR